MTTVRMPVRIRLELDPDQAHPGLAEVVRDATERAATRAATRAGRLPVLRDAIPSAGPGEVTVRFAGDPLPEWLAADLTAGVRAGLHAATTPLRAAPATAPAAASTPRPPATRTRMRLRTFTSLGELWAAVLSHYDGRPPARLLVIARDSEGSPRHWVMTPAGVDELPLVEVSGTFSDWLLPSGGGDARLTGDSNVLADELRYRDRVDTPERFRTVLTAMLLEYLTELHPPRNPTQRRVLADRAANEARRYRFDEPATLYEFFAGGARVRWYLGSAVLTRGSLPVAVLTEEVTLAGGGYGKDCPPLDLTTADEAHLDRPYLGEPSLDEWPGDYLHLAELIKDIATRLRMTEGRYAGSFALVAAAEVARQAELLGTVGGGTLARQAELSRLAQALTLVNNLAAAYVAAMYDLDRGKQLPCPIAARSGQWALHFHQLFIPRRREAVGQLFVSACQDVLLEVLENSAVELARRTAEFPRYMKVTRALLVILLARNVDLVALREKIADTRERELRGRLTVGSPFDWYRASADVVAAVRGGKPDSSAPGSVVFVDNEYWAKDANGRWWSDRQLALAIGTSRKEAFLVDPFLEKVTDLDDIVRRLRDAQARDDAREGAVALEVDAVFAEVLAEVKRENEVRTQRARRDRAIAVGLASFVENRKDEIGARLTGIHRLADERLRPMFEYRAVYVDGLRALTDAELGKAELWEFFNLVGLPFLAVFCPPAAFLIGAVEAVDALVTAYEHRGVQRAILGGDDIITRAQVEAELWAAWIGVALTFLPEVPRATRAVSRALPGSEQRAAAIAATRLAEAEAKRLLAEATSERLVSAFLREAAKGYVLNLALSAVINRFIDAVVGDDVAGNVSPAKLRRVMAEAVRAAGGAS